MTSGGAEALVDPLSFTLLIFFILSFCLGMTWRLSFVCGVFALEKGRRIVFQSRCIKAFYHAIVKGEKDRSRSNVDGNRRCEEVIAKIVSLLEV